MDAAQHNKPRKPPTATTTQGRCAHFGATTCNFFYNSTTTLLATVVCFGASTASIHIRHINALLPLMTSRSESRDGSGTGLASEAALQQPF